MINWILSNLSEERVIKLVIAIAILTVYCICCPAISFIIIKIFRFKENSKKIKDNTFYYPLREFFRISGFYLLIVYLKEVFYIPDYIMAGITKIYKIIVTITLANSLAQSITKKSRIVLRVKERSSKDYDDNSINLIVRFIKTVIYIIAIFIVIAEIGYDLSGLVTGLGLGSVVLTLAAQDTIKNLIGGLIVGMDKPFQVGDFIKVDTYEGTVEDITFRSTRIRTLEDSIIQVPNSLLTADSIENISKLKRRRFKLDIETILDTDIEKLENFERKLRIMLSQNENIIKDTINIHFSEISSNGFNINIFCYLNIVDYIEFLDIKEELNKNIIKIAKEEKIEFAYDTKTIEIKGNNKF